jgi:hypothetical protein
MDYIVRQPAGQCRDCGVLTHDWLGHAARCPVRGLSLFERLTHTDPAVRRAALSTLRPHPRWNTATRPVKSRSRRGLS